jgi:hypothetical protein
VSIGLQHLTHQATTCSSLALLSNVTSSISLSISVFSVVYYLYF